MRAFSKTENRCVREVCEGIRRERGEWRANMAGSYCSAECQRIADATSFQTATPALMSMTWLPWRKDEVRVDDLEPGQ